MVCGSEACCQKGREVGRRKIKRDGTNGKKRKEEGNGNGSSQENLWAEKEDMNCNKVVMR